MAISAGNSAQNSGVLVASVSLSGTLTIASDDNVLLVFVSTGDGATSPTSDVTVAGSSIFANRLYLKNDTTWETVEVYYQLSPSAGTPTITATFAVGSSGQADQASIIGFCLKGVDVGGTPFGTAVTNSSRADASATTGTVTSASGDWVVGSAAMDANTSISGNGTLVQESEGIQGDSCFSVQYITTSSPTLTWTGVGGNGWACAGVPVKAAGGGGRTALNTRSNPLGVEIGMGWRMNIDA